MSFYRAYLMYVVRLASEREWQREKNACCLETSELVPLIGMAAPMRKVRGNRYAGKAGFPVTVARAPFGPNDAEWEPYETR